MQTKTYPWCIFHIDCVPISTGFVLKKVSLWAVCGLHKGHSYQVLLADKNIVRMDVEAASMRSEPISAQYFKLPKLDPCVLCSFVCFDSFGEFY